MEEPETWFDRGIALSAAGDDTGALAAFEKAIACSQSPVEAWCNRGFVSARLGRYRQALDSFDRVLELDPDHEDARRGRAAVEARIADQVVIPLIPSPSPEHSPGPLPAGPGSSPAGTKQIRNPVVAALLSFFFPGWGQWYSGFRGQGLLFLLAAVILAGLNAARIVFLPRNLLVYAVLLIAGLGLTICGMYDAFITAQRINRHEAVFTRKSRLFWLPVILLAAAVILVIVVLAAAFLFAGMGTAGTLHSRVVTASAYQPNVSHIIVLYQGGLDAPQVKNVEVNVTDSEGTSQVELMGPAQSSYPLATGCRIMFYGRFVDSDHVVATALFRDGVKQVILDTYV